MSRRVIAKTFRDAKCPKCARVHATGLVTEDDGWMYRCKCRKKFDPFKAKIVRARYVDLNRRFAGSESVSLCHAFCESEVAEARRRLPEVQECIHDGGRVSFPDRKTERRFNKLFRERIDPT